MKNSKKTMWLELQNKWIRLAPPQLKNRTDSTQSYYFATGP